MSKAAGQSPYGGRSAWLLLLIPCLLSALLSLRLVATQANYQELFNVAITRAPVASFFSFLSPDDPMPLYYLLIHSVSYAVTPTLHELRWLSYGCYILTICAAYWAGIRATGSHAAGAIAGLLIGLSPFMVWYGTRGTMYSLLALATLINQYFFIGILQGSRSSWIGYIPSGVLALGVHYFFAVILVTQLLFVLGEYRQLPKRTVWPVLASSAIFTALFAAWVQASLRHSATWQYLPYTAKPSATNIFIIYTQYLFGFQSVLTTTLIIAFWPLLVILSLLAVQKYVRPPIAIRYASFAAWAPILLMFALGWLWRPLFLSSYLIVCMPALALALGWYLSAYELRALAWARNVLVATMGVMLLIQTTHPELAVRGDYLGVLRLLAPRRLPVRSKRQGFSVLGPPGSGRRTAVAGTVRLARRLDP